MKQGRGFTLIEIAVVLFLIALLMAAGVRYLNSQLTSAAYSATNTKLATIKDALTTYLGKNKRLPCPDDPANDGALGGGESRDPTNPVCYHYFGVVPYAELGLTKDVALDGWGNYFSYAVSPKWTLTVGTPDTNKITTDPTKGFTTGLTGALTVSTRNPDNAAPTVIADAAALPTSTGAAAVVLSYGKNGAGGWTSKGTQNAAPAGADEQVNALAAQTSFMKREYTESDNGFGAFDDLLLMIKPDDLVTPLTKDGTFASGSGALNQAFAALNNAILGATLASAPAPSATYTLPSTLTGLGVSTVDPYGCGAITYVPYSGPPANITSTTPVSGTVVYTLSSCVAGGSTYSMTVDELRGMLLKNGMMTP